MKKLTLALVSSMVACSALLPLVPQFAFAAAGSSAGALNGRLDAISEILDHKAGDAPSLLEEVAGIVKANPKSARAHLLAGRLYERSGFNELAEQEYIKADELDPSTPHAVLDLFLLKLESDDLSGAWERLGYLMSRFPNDPAVSLMKAMILEGAGKNEKAEQMLEAALKNKQKRTGVATAVASTRLRQKRPAEAWELVQTDLARDPNYFRANVVAGEALMQLNQTERATKYLQKAYDMNPLDRNFVNVYATNLYRAGLYAKALEPALIYLSEQTDASKMTKAKMQVIVLLRKLSDKDIQDAIAAADKKLDKTQWQGRLQLALGDIFDSLGKRKLAEQAYGNGIELLPDMGRPYYRLAMDYEKDGRSQDAFMLYQKAYELQPQDQQVKSAFTRFYQRATNRHNDIAWRLKDWIRAR
jgi:Tfp pilus assembly protein PilF